MNSKRVNPLDIEDSSAEATKSAAATLSDLSDLLPRGDRRQINQAEINDIAQSSGFPSREARKQRRNFTGRNRQFTVKLTGHYHDLIYAIADQKRVPLAEIIEQAVDALIKQSGTGHSEAKTS